MVRSRPPPGGDRYEAAFEAAAQKYGVSELYLRKMATIESGGRPNAVQGSSRGLMQFQPAAAAEVGLKNPFDPVASIYAAAKLAARNEHYLSSKLGRPVQDWELYLAHQQGRFGAEALLKNPDRMAIAALGRFYDNPGAAITGNGGRRSMTSDQFSELWERRYNQAKPMGGFPDNARTSRPLAEGSRPAKFGDDPDSIRVSSDFAAKGRSGGFKGENQVRERFNGASYDTPEHQSIREAALRREPLEPTEPRGSAFQQSFHHYSGFNDRNSPTAAMPDPNKAPMPDRPAGPSDDRKPHVFDRDHFTPMGNG